MAAMTQEYIISQTRSVAQGLEALRVEHTDLLNGLQPQEAQAARDEASLISKNIEMIELGLDEAEVMVTLANPVEMVEAEMQILRYRVRMLRQENDWLREEIFDTQQKLHASEKTVAQLEEDKKHFEFMASMRQYDPPVGDENAKDSPKDDPIVDLFPDDDTEEQNTISTTPPLQAAQQDTTSYEIPARLRTLHNLVIKYASQGRYEVAVPLCKQTLNDLEEMWGHDHPDVATMLSILAVVYRDQKKYKEAMDLLYDALAIREKTLGENHLTVAATLNNLAILCGKRGKHRKAEPLCKRALEIRKQVFGENHTDVATQLTNLALICKVQGKYEEAERYYKQALEIYESKLGPDDPNVAKTKNNLASCYLKQGKCKDAAVLHKQVMTKAHKRELGAIAGDNEPIGSPLAAHWQPIDILFSKLEIKGVLSL